MYNTKHPNHPLVDKHTTQQQKRQNMTFKLPEIKQGEYNCGVLNCGNGQCTHQWIQFFCPHCDNQLVHVTNNNNVFCSNHTYICDFESHITKQKQFNSLIDTLKNTKLALLINEETIKKNLSTVRHQISDLQNMINRTIENKPPAIKKPS